MSLAELARHVRILADPLRIRILGLLVGEEVTVTELTRILNCGQSRVSGQLARLTEAGLVEARREGRFLLYRACEDLLAADPLAGGILASFADSEEALRDRESLATVTAERPTGPPPGALGRDYLPGRTWEGFAKMLLAALPSLRIADLGIGRGEMTLLLAEGAERVVAVDRDEEILAEARARAASAGLAGRIDFRAGDLADPPIEPGEVDLWVLSQVLHLVEKPGDALDAAHARLDVGGRVLVLDLLAHHEAWVRERLGHHGLGFGEEELADLLTRAGFDDVSVRRASRDRKPPHFVTLLATGRKTS